MPTVRKVTSKIKLTPKPSKVASATSGKVTKTTEVTGDDRTAPVVRTKRVCLFCESKTEPRYWDVATLRRFLSDRGRINPRGRSGACAKHQRRIARAIKHARHLALLPYIVRVV